MPDRKFDTETPRIGLQLLVLCSTQEVYCKHILGLLSIGPNEPGTCFLSTLFPSSFQQQMGGMGSVRNIWGRGTWEVKPLQIDLIRTKTGESGKLVFLSLSTDANSSHVHLRSPGRTKVPKNEISLFRFLSLSLSLPLGLPPKRISPAAGDKLNAPLASTSNTPMAVPRWVHLILQSNLSPGALVSFSQQSPCLLWWRFTVAVH